MLDDVGRRDVFARIGKFIRYAASVCRWYPAERPSPRGPFFVDPELGEGGGIVPWRCQRCPARGNSSPSTLSPTRPLFLARKLAPSPLRLREIGKLRGELQIRITPHHARL